MSCDNDAAIPIAVASAETIKEMGYVDGFGPIADGVTTFNLEPSDSTLFGVGGPLEGQIVAATASGASNSTDPSVALIVLRTVSATAVEPTLSLVRGAFSGVDPTSYTIDARTDVIEAAQSVDQSLLQNTRTQAALALGVAAAMVAVSEFSVARSRRKLTGLKRALGATRLQIAASACFSAAIYALAGVLAGCATAVLYSLLSETPLPPISFIAATCIVAVLTVVSAALLPAIYSSARQPARELRTP
ncbi:FtsX-like permease family protein [Microbacterium sp. BG28]|uniref:ABC transporter permease n=1 Tax=Microbacterium sp. BG28 TaxID=3097356 RepID=UPI002A5A68EA|nr:FtsX-like permease family protein [Microbacterium sp. BG28]MDY0827782.1 FtsX-like permease family protein [Microbacterium sp. BG28]